MSVFPLALAQTIVAAACSHARGLGLEPVAVIVLDAGGHPVSFARVDGATIFRHETARAKAMGAIGMGADTRAIAERAKNNPTFFQSLAAVVQGNIAFSPGGVVIRDSAGDILGAVGVSGDTGDADEACALAGVAAAGWGASA